MAETIVCWLMYFGVFNCSWTTLLHYVQTMKFMFDWGFRIGIKDSNFAVQVFFERDTRKRWRRWLRRGRWRGTRGYSLWCLWRKLCIRRVLDLLWHMWEMVPWEVCEDHSSEGWTYQAVQVPIVQQQKSSALSFASKASEFVSCIDCTLPFCW